MLRPLAATGNDLLSWFNDLVSLERDRVTSGGHNLVLAIAREQRVPDERAAEAAVARWRAAMGRFMALRAAMPSFGPALDPAVAEHLDGIARGAGHHRLVVGERPIFGIPERPRRLPGQRVRR